MGVDRIPVGAETREYNKKQFIFRHPLTTQPRIERIVGTFTHTFGNGGLASAMSAAGADKIIEYIIWGRIAGDNIWEIRAGDSALKKQRFRAFIGMYSPLNATPTTFAGIEIGSMCQAPPFPTIPTGGAVTQLRMRMDNQHIQLLTAQGDTVTPAKITEVDLGIILPHGVFAEVILDPYERTVTAYIDGQQIAQHSGNDYPNMAINTPGSAELDAGLFFTSGSNAAASHTTWFSLPEYEVYDWARPGAVL
jgi:hypothetical protein